MMRVSFHMFVEFAFLFFEMRHVRVGILHIFEYVVGSELFDVSCIAYSRFHLFVSCLPNVFCFFVGKQILQLEKLFELVCTVKFIGPPVDFIFTSIGRAVTRGVVAPSVAHGFAQHGSLVAIWVVTRDHVATHLSRCHAGQGTRPVEPHRWDVHRGASAGHSVTVILVCHRGRNSLGVIPDEYEEGAFGGGCEQKSRVKIAGTGSTFSLKRNRNVRAAIQFLRIGMTRTLNGVGTQARRYSELMFFFVSVMHWHLSSLALISLVADNLS